MLLQKLSKAKRNYCCQNVTLGQVIINNRGLSSQYIKNKEKKHCTLWNTFISLVGSPDTKQLFAQS